GGIGGGMRDGTLLPGGAGYWLPNDPNGTHMSCGGRVLLWPVHADRRFAWSARALVGGGGATVTETLANLGIPPEPRPPYVDPRHPNGGGRFPRFPPRDGGPVAPNARGGAPTAFFVPRPPGAAPQRRKERSRP